MKIYLCVLLQSFFLIGSEEKPSMHNQNKKEEHSFDSFPHDKKSEKIQAWIGSVEHPMGTALLRIRVLQEQLKMQKTPSEKKKADVALKII